MELDSNDSVRDDGEANGQPQAAPTSGKPRILPREALHAELADTLCRIEREGKPRFPTRPEHVTNLPRVGYMLQ